MKAFYFSNSEKRLAFGDNRPIEVGITHKVEGEIKCCYRGLHASKTLIDALRYGRGTTLYLVELSGTIHENYDKVAASERTYLAEFDVTDVLRDFAKSCAKQHVHKIKKYLDDSIYKDLESWLDGYGTLSLDRFVTIRRHIGSSTLATHRKSNTHELENWRQLVSYALHIQGDEGLEIFHRISCVLRVAYNMSDIFVKRRINKELTDKVLSLTGWEI